MSFKTEANKKIKSTNRDPITDAAGAHPIGTGIDAVLRGTAAAVLGDSHRDGK